MAKSVAEGLAQEFNLQTDCDVTFYVDGKTVSAHTIVLKVRSAVLHKMAAQWTPEQEPIPIEDIDYESFLTLIWYIYTDDILLSKNNVFTFLHAAMRFQVHSLEKECADFIGGFMEYENMYILMNDAVDFKSTALQKKCRAYFSDHTYQSLRLYTFRELTQPALSAFLDVDVLDVTEIYLFAFIKRWMVKHSRHPVNGPNMRKTIGEALFKIRFPTMNVQDFANSVTTIKGLLTDTEISLIFQNIAVFDNEDIECPFPSDFRCHESWANPPSVADLDVKELCERMGFYDRYTDVFFTMENVEEYLSGRIPPRGKKFSLTSYRLICQCCADIANSFDTVVHANFQNVTLRRQLFQDFKPSQNFFGGNLNGMMTRYMGFRRKFSRLISWW